MRKNIGKRLISVALSVLLVFNSGAMTGWAVETEDGIQQITTEDVQTDETSQTDEENQTDETSQTDEENQTDETSQTDEENQIDETSQLESETEEVEPTDENKTEDETLKETESLEEETSSNDLEDITEDNISTEDVTKDSTQEDENTENTIQTEVTTEDKVQDSQEQTTDPFSTEETTQKQQETEQLPQESSKEETTPSLETETNGKEQSPTQNVSLDQGIMFAANGDGGVESKHIDSLANVLLDESFDSGDNWDISETNAGAISIADGVVTINKAGQNNRLGYRGGKINADNFLIQLDITPHMNRAVSAECAADLKVAFKIQDGEDGYEEDRLQVRFHFQPNGKNSKPLIYIERTAKNAEASTTSTIWKPSEELDWDWKTNQTYQVDILVSSKENKIYLYLDGVLFKEQEYEGISSMEKGGFAIAGTWGNQNFTIDNLKITTDEELIPDTGDNGNDKTEVIHSLEAYDRILLQDTFENGNNWDVKNANGFVTFENGKAIFKGGGPCNRIGYNAGRINANDFLVQLDLTRNAGDTNSNVKVAFKITDQYEGDRLQVRFDTKNGTIFIERTKNNSVVSFDKVWSKECAYTFEIGKTYAVDILVKDSTIQVYLNGESTPVFEATHDDIKNMTKGYFAIAGQYPNQDFTIDNLVISTDEVQTGDQYTVNLKVATNGDEENSSGGTLTADLLQGYEGDIVTLAVNPAHGYVFDRFESFKGDGSSTDGLMPITNNRFSLNSKFGNVTVVAHFKTREPGRFELFYDDFAAESLATEYKTIKDPTTITQENRELTINSTDGPNYLLLDQTIFQNLKDGEGYRISVDMWKGNGDKGTVQIAFKGADDLLGERYVLVLNGTESVFRHLHDGGNDQLKLTAFTFSSTKVHVELEVRGNRVVFYADGKEILSYTTDSTTENWSNQPNAVGLINMTPNVPVVFDNLLVERLPEQTSVSIKVMKEENGVLTEDTEGVSGTVTADMTSVVEGDTVTLSILEKAGYQWKEFYIEDSSEIEVKENSFTVPEGITGTICVVAVFEAVAQGEGRGYYIDSEEGNDDNAGTIDAPWQTLNRLADSNTVLVPGDCIYLKRGSVFDSQQLRFQGMGTKEKPIIIDAYGEGDSLPQLNGNGEIENVVSLYNQEYIEIRNLEITNTSSKYTSSFGLNASNNTSLALRAINISAKDFGTVSGIRIQDCYIHDINGNINLKWNGGIFFDVQASIVDGKLTGVLTKYDDIIIEGCTFINVDRSGIKLVSSKWCNQWEPNDRNTPINWYPSTNIIIRNNYMEKIGGDGITTRDTDGTLIEHNLVKDCRYQNTAYNVGIWPFQAANTVIQYNEAYDTHSTQDGQGLDCDHASSYSLMQYNYSHNNEGGFMLIMGGYPHTAATVRYNISQNDKDKAFEFAQGIPKGTMIYNNTIYSDTTLSRGIFHLSNTGAGLGVNDMYIFNNIFCYPEGQTYYSGETEKVSGAAKLYNNAYVGGIEAPSTDSSAVVVADENSVFIDPGKVPEINDTKVPRTGSSGELDGYQLAEGAEVIDKGITLQEAITYFGNGTANVIDGTNLSPRELYEQNKSQNAASINCIMGENFPNIDGVNYNLDFFGNSNLEGDKPDIGAAEFLQHTHEGGTATCSKKAVCTICGLEYGELDSENHSFTEYVSDQNATCTENGTKTAICDNGCGTKDTIEEADTAKGHKGGTATCSKKAVCEVCNTEYGELDPTNHVGDTEIRNAKEPTVTEEGYTGDVYCKECGEKISDGEIIEKLPDETTSEETTPEETTPEETTPEETTPEETTPEETTPEETTPEETTPEETTPDTSDDSDDSDDNYYEPEPETTLTKKEENLVENVLGISAVKEVTENEAGKLVVAVNAEVVFVEKDGTLSKDKWQQVDGSWYFFDKDSKAADGWLEQNGKWYYLNESHKKMETGWLKTKDGNWYLLDNTNGDMKTGWQQTKDGKWYLLDHANGDMKTGWQQTKDGKWYLLDHANGDMKTGWQQTKDGKWYLLDHANGDMKTGWQMVKGIWYYLDQLGAMAEDTITPDGYRVGKNGAWTGEKVR